MASDHLALMSRMAAAAEIRDSRLEAIALDSPFLTRTIGILWRDDRLTPPIAFAMEAVEATCAEAELMAPQSTMQRRNGRKVRPRGTG